MHLEGSCHGRSVRFTVESPDPYPCNRCDCSICRKTAVDGGNAINLGARNETLQDTGRENLAIYRTPGPAHLRTPGPAHLMVASKAAWVECQSARGDEVFDGYPEESLEQRHRRRGRGDRE